MRRSIPWTIVAASIALLVGSGAAADYTSTWYRALRRPTWLVFERHIPAIWLVIYVCSTLSAIRAYQNVSRPTARRAIFALFAANAVAHFSFSVLFTRLHSLLGAVIDSRIITGTIATITVLQWRHDRLAALLNLPYVLWSFVAAWVVTAIFALNRNTSPASVAEHIESLRGLP